MLMKQRMKKNYLMTTEDLGDFHPFLKSYLGKGLGRILLELLGVQQLNKIHAEYCHLNQWEMTTAILKDRRVDVQYRVHGKEYLERMKEIGAFFTISNHPFGGIDGVILIDIITRIRPDFKVLVNDILTRVTGLKDVWIPVHPPIPAEGYIHDPSKNIFGLKMVVDDINKGIPVGMFPAGTVPEYNKQLKRPIEQPWNMNNIRIIHNSNVPLFPIAFDGNNSSWFFRIGELFNYQITSLQLPTEILRKKGKTIDVYVGAPIMPEEIVNFASLKSLRSFLFERTLGMLPSYQEIIGNILKD